MEGKAEDSVTQETFKKNKASHFQIRSSLYFCSTVASEKQDDEGPLRIIFKFSPIIL